jgi:hypothetical protein
MTNYITAAKRHPLVIWTLVYSALTVAVTFPLALNVSSKVPHDLGDPLLTTSLLWWNAHVMPLTRQWWNGFAFFPAPGMLAFSDHRLGESLLASPLQWLGCSPLSAYNLTLLATFPACAVAAHWLAFTLTRRHDAAALCGLAYGFNPYRFTHVEHLELLAAFGIPAALAAAHLYIRTHRARWLMVLAAALLLQGLCTSYYLAFLSVLLALWIVWFVSWREPGTLAALAGAGGCAALALVPIARGYLQIHREYGFVRGLGQAVAFSGDVTSFATASNFSVLWGWTSRFNGPERQLFPGLTIAVLALVGGVMAARSIPPSRDWGDRVSKWLLIASCGIFVLALGTEYFGSWRFALGPLVVSASHLYKPLSVALATLVAAAACSSRVRAAWRSRSTLAFYLAAAAFLFLCSLGPKPTFLGKQVLYEPPYLWLMRLPVFDTGIRVPARFAMLGALALCVSGALAFHRFRWPEAKRRWLAVVFAVGIAADAWIRGMPLLDLPNSWPIQQAQAFDAVVELPIGDLFQDAAAMYRATIHHRPIVNGMSGFEPAHYMALRLSAMEGDFTALDAVVAPGKRILAVIDRKADVEGKWLRYLNSNPRATRLPDADDRSFFALSGEAQPLSCQGAGVGIASAFDRRGPVDVAALTDDDIRTFWSTIEPQQPGDMLTIDLGRIASVCAVRAALGPDVELFPRGLDLSVSVDGVSWETRFHGTTSSHAVRGALERPADVWLEFPMQTPTPARFVRFRLEASHAIYPINLTEVSVQSGESAGR